MKSSARSLRTQQCARCPPPEPVPAFQTPPTPLPGEGAAVLATDQTMSTVLMFHPRAPACERSPQKPAHPTTPLQDEPARTRWADAP